MRKIAETLIYFNRLKEETDIKDFILEGNAIIDFKENCMELKNKEAVELGQKANYVLWCNELFPADIKIEWEFLPCSDVGLSILFFASTGRGGEDLFSTSLSKRTGEYPQYHSGDINAFHVSYFRRKEMEEREFHTCNLRKSHGFHLVAQGADPIPGAMDALNFYKISLIKYKEKVEFYINDLSIFTYIDDSITYGPLLKEGRIGFRQLAPLIGRYRNLKVYKLEELEVEL